jgi:ATP-dependent helicase/nuclease subunit B
VLSWQAHRNGEANPVSNWVARLELALAQCGSVGLARHLAPLSAVTLLPTPLQQPAPAAPLLAPQRLSASGYASLAACPYQFFAARMLRLARLDELSEQVEKRDYGDWLHRILHRYHVGLAEHAIAPAQRGDYLQAVTQEVFGPELAASGAALGFHDRWQKAMPAYLAWAAQREQLGWTFVDGEQAREQQLSWSGGSVLLHGRIDRIDADAAGAVALIDYKTSSPAALKKRIDANEDHQLAFYGLLAATPPEAAAYVSLEPQRGAIVDLETADYAYWQEQLRERIAAAMQAIAAGAGLRASGVESTCSYCAMRGLCRKGAW